MEISTVVNLKENLWAINELGKTTMYFVNGSKKVLLLDTGLGLLDLKGKVKELCGDKPIVVVNSHGHMDHNSGNNQFEEVFVGRYDEPESHHIMFEDDKQEMMGYFMEKLIADNYDFSEWHPGPAMKILPLKNGDIIDIGTYCFKVIEAPGHSLGSIVLFEEKEGWMFTGDLMLTWEVWGQLENSTTLKQYYETIVLLCKLKVEVKAIFPAHGIAEKKVEGYSEYELPIEVLDIYANGIYSILEGKAVASDYPFGGKRMKSATFDIGGIIYDPERLGV